jgi:hypothetical protein
VKSTDAQRSPQSVPIGGETGQVTGHAVVERVVNRLIRTYDANGRMMEENQIQENPALMFERRSGELDC